MNQFSQNQRTLEGVYVAMASDKHENLIPVLENSNRMDDVVIPADSQNFNKLQDKAEDVLSSVSEAPSVEHFNISVSHVIL